MAYYFGKLARKHLLLILLFVVTGTSIYAKTFSYRKVGLVPRSPKIREQRIARLTPRIVKDWSDLKVINGPNVKYESLKKDFIIESGAECPDGCGDAARYKFSLKSKDGRIEKFGDRWIGVVFVTSDERYIISEKFVVFDTSVWKNVEVDRKFLDSTIYLSIHRYSPSQRKLLIEESPCMDGCMTESNTLWEVQLP